MEWGVFGIIMGMVGVLYCKLESFCSFFGENHHEYCILLEVCSAATKFIDCSCKLELKIAIAPWMICSV